MGDLVFMFFLVLLVWIMILVIVLFYGGMVWSKNMLSIVMYSVGFLVVIFVFWIVVGYLLVFLIGGNVFIGNLDWVGLKGVGFILNGDYSVMILYNMFMMF